ncbi:DNA polymerase III subunit delta [Fervidibacillus halotolerans]|uniref:DNA polymerase III subunit delta n=1 Tax=Fervidibacillus halotolerans TaxID=2980027 RepID=A0A9E8LXK5_9BACI|nr:DNA polymerase III subunit delta [Fervidibacillus halotolerans]WAA11517.1 DNA polymerase III subunit delta [Fervidibacillus halotolerans]
MVLQIWKDIRKNKLAPLYVLYGKERYLIDETKRLIIKHALNGQDNEFNLSSYDLEETPVEQVIDDCITVPFFSDKKVVIADRAYFLTSEKRKETIEHNLHALESYINEPVPSSILVLIAPYEKLDERKKLTKLLLKNTVSIEAKPLTERDAKKWIREQFDEEGFEITDRGLDLIFHYVGANLASLNNEIEKILLYGEKGDLIDEQTVELLVAKSFESNIFSLVDKVVHKRLDEALEIYYQLLKQNEDPIQIAAAIGSQFRVIYQSKVLSKRGYGQKAISGQLKIHPYRVKLALEQGRSFSFNQLMEIMNSLAEMDYQLKTSFGNKERLLELFFFKFLQT